MEQVTRDELLDRLEHEHARLSALLDQLTPGRMIAPNILGEWSVKDLLAHLIVHEQRALAEVTSALSGQRLQIDHAANNAFNEQAVATSRPQSLQAVRDAWDASYLLVVETVAALSDAAFDPASPIVAVLGDSIDGALGNNTYGHYAKHRRQLEAWLGTGTVPRKYIAPST